MALYEKNVTKSSKFCNDLVPVDSDYTAQATGSIKLPRNMTAKVALVKLSAPIGSKLIGVTLHGGAGAAADNATAVTLSIRKVIHKAGGVTDAEVKGVSAVSSVADTKLDIKANFEEVVREDYSYYARVTATTADNAACDLEVIGATVDYQ
jgi:hypothetical protein